MAAGEKMWTEKRSLIWRKGDELTAWPGLDIIQNNKENQKFWGQNRMYMTAQRKLLFRYFSEHPDVSVTARQLCGVLNNGDQVKIGLSSIYRNLAELTKAGFILQTISQDSKEARYRYVSPETCSHRLHLTCLRCGKTFHMTQKLSDRLLTDILRVEDFAVDENQTTVYGLCRDCREQRN